MESLTAWKASDGSLFESQEQCEAHEVSLVWREKIAAFNDSGLNPYSRGPHFSMARTLIIAWERFKVLTAGKK